MRTHTHSTQTTHIYQHPHSSHHLLFMFLGMVTQAHTDRYLMKVFSENRHSNTQINCAWISYYLFLSDVAHNFMLMILITISS